MKKQEYIEKYGEEAYKRCLERQREYQKQYREQHKNEIREYQQQHKEEHKQWQRKKRYMFSYCIPEEIEQIENYELAKADNFNGWHLHHRLECIETGAVVNSSAQDLKDWGIYYNRPANELIFLTKSEHCSLHKRKKNREGL